MLWLKIEVATVLLLVFVCSTGSDPKTTRRRRSSRRRSTCIPVPCLTSAWSEWSSCGARCEVRTATRKEITSAKCGGSCTLKNWKWYGQLKCFNGGSLEDEKCVCKKGYSGYCCEEQGGNTGLVVGVTVGGICGCCLVILILFACCKELINNQVSPQ